MDRYRDTSTDRRTRYGRDLLPAIFERYEKHERTYDGRRANAPPKQLARDDRAPEPDHTFAKWLDAQVSRNSKAGKHESFDVLRARYAAKYGSPQLEPERVTYSKPKPQPAPFAEAVAAQAALDARAGFWRSYDQIAARVREKQAAGPTRYSVTDADLQKVIRAVQNLDEFRWAKDQMDHDANAIAQQNEIDLKAGRYRKYDEIAAALTR